MSPSLTCPACSGTFPAGTNACPDDGTPLREVEATAIVDPVIGQKVGDYLVEARIGVGGMGIVYRARHPDIGKVVAVKVLKPEIANDPDQMQRLLSEARSVNAVRDPGIIDIFGFGRLQDGRQYMLMEFLEGKALDEVIAEEQALPLPRALALFDEMLSALGAAHRAGVIHRDLKPSNVFLVRKSDGSHYVKVVDFGLAKKSISPTGLTPQTYVDRVVGTPEFMAPEQARGESVSTRTDLYAMGVMLFEMITGTVPFTAATMLQLVVKHLEEAPPAPSSRRDGIPPELDSLVLWLMEKEPENRPESTEAIRDVLRPIIAQVASLPASARASGVHASGNPKLASAPTRVQSNTTLVLKKPSRLPIAGAVIVALVLVAGGYFALSSSTPQTPQPAPRAAGLDVAPAPAPVPVIAVAPPPAPTPTPSAVEPEPEPAPSPAAAAPVVERVVAPAPAIVVPAATVKQVTPKQTVRSAPTQEQLRKRAKELDRKLRAAEASGTLKNRALFPLLERTRDRIETAKSDDARRDLDATLTELTRSVPAGR